jgi:alcohol dehydrogenase (cytochrome c)
MPTLFRNYEPATAERLKNPEPTNWLHIRGNYAGWGYSELDQITANNVNRLQLAWVFSTRAVNAHEAAPLLNNGVM